MDKIIIWPEEIAMEPTWDRPLTDKELVINSQFMADEEKKQMEIKEVVEGWKKGELSGDAAMIVICDILNPAKPTKEDIEWAKKELKKIKHEEVKHEKVNEHHSGNGVFNGDDRNGLDK